MQAQVVRHMRNIYRVFRDIALFPKNVCKIKRVVEGRTYYPEKKRKSKAKRIVENFIYLLKYHETNIFYNSYGLDIENFRDVKDYLPRRHFVLSRDNGNIKYISSETGEYNYITLLRDKYVFAAYLTSTIGKSYVPKTIGIINNGQVFLTASNEWISVDVFMRKKFTYVFKKINGECADGVFLVKADRGYILSEGERFSASEYSKKISGSRIIIQEKLQQHENLEQLNPYCVNTIRIITITDKKGNIEIFAAFLRLGITKDSFVDNRAKGGLGVGINLESGRLDEFGFVHDAFGTKLLSHPLTGVIFKDYQLPHWDKVKDLVKASHKQFYEIQSIGWDIVITPTGPVILEGNDDWEIAGPQDTGGGLRKKWMKLTGEKI